MPAWRWHGPVGARPRGWRPGRSSGTPCVPAGSRPRKLRQQRRARLARRQLRDALVVAASVMPVTMELPASSGDSSSSVVVPSDSPTRTRTGTRLPSLNCHTRADASGAGDRPECRVDGRGLRRRSQNRSRQFRPWPPAVSRSRARDMRLAGRARLAQRGQDLGRGPEAGRDRARARQRPYAAAGRRADGQPRHACTSIEVMGIFQRLNVERGITIVLVTHEATSPNMRRAPSRSATASSGAIRSSRIAGWPPLKSSAFAKRRRRPRRARKGARSCPC